MRNMEIINHSLSHPEGRQIKYILLYNALMLVNENPFEHATKISVTWEKSKNYENKYVIYIC